MKRCAGSVYRYTKYEVQTQPRKQVLAHADCTAPMRQRELDHTDQEKKCPERSRS